MLKPHCDYCDSVVKGREDPHGVPCNLCVDKLNDALDFDSDHLSFDIGVVRIALPEKNTNGKSIFLSNEVMDVWFDKTLPALEELSEVISPKEKKDEALQL